MLYVNVLIFVLILYIYCILSITGSNILFIIISITTIRTPTPFEYRNDEKLFECTKLYQLHYPASVINEMRWYDSRLRWSRGSVLAFGTQGSNPAEAVGFLRAKKILSTPSFGGEVKPSVPCRRSAACKRSLELGGSQILDEICRNTSRPRRVPPSAARGLSRRWTWRHLAEKVGTLKAGESNGNLPLRTCPGCSVPEPYRSPNWVLVPTKPA